MAAGNVWAATYKWFTPGCCLAQLSVNLIFYFCFLFDEQARQTETNGLSIEVIRNLADAMIYTDGLS